MNFTSTLFLFLFFPIFLIVYFLIPGIRFKNIFLLLSSLYFYSTGEPLFVFVMIISILLNYEIARRIHCSRNGKIRKFLYRLAFILNLSLLGVFKYTDFILANLNSLFGWNIPPTSIPLPIGISFFTFQAMSYVFDVYYDEAGNDEKYYQDDLITFGLYISMFPQLVAGPIVRYSDIAGEITNRKTDIAQLNQGIRRFIYGLAKKILIANSMSIVVDRVFSIEPTEAGSLFLILGAVSYTLQIYFDFSGYSDMAVGIGKMLGFTFPENFNSPYMAKSVTDYWKRWHMTLSSWFRDYVYIPMGGSKEGFARTVLNLLIVWIFTGLWHGANWTFIVWGLINFVFLTFERSLRFYKKKGIEEILPSFLSRIYALAVISLSLVIFRSDNLSNAHAYIVNMFDFSNLGAVANQASFYLGDFWIFYLIAVLHCGDFFKRFSVFTSKDAQEGEFSLIGDVFAMGLLILCSFYIIKGSYNPFIYFNF